jgi:hypothetical protein
MQSPSFGWIKFNNLFDTFDQNGGGTYDRKRISDVAYSLELYVMQREQSMP